MKTLLAFSLLLAVTGVSPLLAAVPVAGEFDDPNILYVGRWQQRDAAVASSHWGSAYLRCGFTGPRLKVRLTQTGGVEALIDGKAVNPVPCDGGVNLTPEPLAPGPHTLLLAAKGQNAEMVFQGLELAPGEKTLPADTRPLIEFVGDSITACSGKPQAELAAAKSKEELAKVAPGPAMSNYAWIAGENLRADHVQIAFSGVALTDGMGFFGDKTGMETWYFKAKNCNHKEDNADWSFLYTPQLVVVNLGTNDIKDGKRPDAAAFAATYGQFLGKLRAKFPQATLVALRPFGGFGEAGIRQAVETRKAAGDANVHYIDTAGWLDKSDTSDGYHPTVEGHAKAAERLTAALRPLLARSAAPVRGMRN